VVAFSSAITRKASPRREAPRHAVGDRDPSDAPRPKRERTKAFARKSFFTIARPRIAKELRVHSPSKRHATLVPLTTIPSSSPAGTAGREIIEDLAALGLKPDIAVIGASGGGLAPASRWAEGTRARRRNLHRGARGIR